jgi:hypothetical protein
VFYLDEHSEPFFVYLTVFLWLLPTPRHLSPLRAMGKAGADMGDMDNDDDHTAKQNSSSQTGRKVQVYIISERNLIYGG